MHVKRVCAIVALMLGIVPATSISASAAWSGWSNWQETYVAGVWWRVNCSTFVYSGNQHEFSYQFRNSTSSTLSFKFQLYVDGVGDPAGLVTRTLGPGEITGGEGAGDYSMFSAPCPNQDVQLRSGPA